MKVQVKIDKNAALKAGLDRHGPVIVEVPAAALSDQMREELANYADSGQADYALGDEVRLQSHVRSELSNVDLSPAVTFLRGTPDEVATWLTSAANLRERALRAYRNKQQSEESGALEKLLAILRERKTRSRDETVWSSGLRGQYQYLSPADDLGMRLNSAADRLQLEDRSPQKPPEWLAWERELDAANAAAKAACERELAERAAAIKADEERGEKEISEWIEQHGSRRLKLSHKEGIECGGVYRAERLAHDLPGWSYTKTTPGAYDEPRNPPEEAFDVLEQARKQLPAATLQRWTIKESDVCQDSDEDGVNWRGYVAIGEFLGREVVCGVPADYVED